MQLYQGAMLFCMLTLKKLHAMFALRSCTDKKAYGASLTL